MGLKWGRAASRRPQEEAERDLQQLRQTERELRAALDSRSRDFESLMDRCGAAAIYLDSEGVILHCNRDARLLLSMRGAAAEGQTLVAATLSDELNDLFKRARQRGRAVAGEVRAPTAGGSVLEAEVTEIATDEAARPRYLLIAQDITARRRLETMRRDFVANVSHELRTPLASIRAMAETLQDGALSDPAVAGKFLATIVNETDRLARISEDLLVLSDAESHAPEKSIVDLSELIDLVVSRSRPQAERAGLTLAADIAHGMKVPANRDQIEQVLVNLIDNAIKYTGEGGAVGVRAALQGNFVEVRVSDTGIGIMSQDLPRIFERFYRVDRARSRQSGGTGLGLSIVKHIVECHQGTVAVESEYNHGSTFTFTLPATFVR